MNILIIGGSRYVGPTLIEILRAHNKLTVFNRGRLQDKYPSGIIFIRGDRKKSLNIRGHFDAVIDMCAYNPKDVIDVFNNISMDQYLYISSAGVYAKSNHESKKLSENSKLTKSKNPYIHNKILCEKIVQKYSKKNLYSTKNKEKKNKKNNPTLCTILRPSHIFTRSKLSNREYLIYSKIVHNKEICLSNNGKTLINPVFTSDVAKAISLLIHKKCSGTYNCVGDSIITHEELVKKMGVLCHKKPIIIKKNNNKAYDNPSDPRYFPFSSNSEKYSNKKIKNAGMKFKSFHNGLKEDYLMYYRKELNK
jgi:nucleoside-diphosphate-sugar epimerase